MCVMSQCESVDSFTPCYLAHAPNLKLSVSLGFFNTMKDNILLSFLKCPMLKVQ